MLCNGGMYSEWVKLPIPKRGSRSRRPLLERSDGFVVISARFAMIATEKHT